MLMQAEMWELHELECERAEAEFKSATPLSAAVDRVMGEDVFRARSNAAAYPLQHARDTYEVTTVRVNDLQLEVRNLTISADRAEREITMFGETLRRFVPAPQRLSAEFDVAHNMVPHPGETFLISGGGLPEAIEFRVISIEISASAAGATTCRIEAEEAAG